MTRSDCLTPDELAALASGELAAEWLERAAAHVDVCTACLAAVPAAGTDDPLVAVLRLDAALAAGPAAGPDGRYEAIRLHAVGGLGEVHVAEDTELGRRVALKRLRPARADDPDSRRRFLREAAITARLEHPGVVPVYGLIRDPAGRPHYAMRLVAGESLQDAIRTFHAADRASSAARGASRLALRGLLTAFVTVCRTVAYAHTKGVVHRDLKPANVMLGDYGETLVIDWGLAKVFGPDGSAAADDGEPRAAVPLPEDDTRTGATVGTPKYMSPEQAAGRNAEVGPASDVYALGATLYAVLTGDPPGDPPADRPRRATRGVPRALGAVCRKALAERPEGRYATAGELGVEVERWLAGEPVAALPEGLTTRALRGARRYRVAVAGFLSAVLVGVTVGAWGLREATDRRAEQNRLEQTDGEAVDRACAAVPGLVGGWRFREALGLLDQTHLGLSAFASEATRDRLEEVRGDVRLAAALDAVRLEQSECVDERRPDPALAATRYDAAFRENGLDCTGGEDSVLGARIGRSVVRNALAGALDEWAYGERDGPRREKVTRVARAADPHPEWRDSFRDALARVGRTRMTELAAGADVKRLAPHSVVTLGLALGGTSREAERLFRAAQPHHPTDFWINCYLAAAISSRATDRDGAAQAVSYFRACLVARPDAAPVHNDLALALRTQGDYAGAAASARRAVELRPQSANAWNTLGVVSSAGGDAAAAEHAYRRAIQLDATFAAAHRGLGAALRGAGNTSGSEASYRRAVRLDPKNAKVHNSLGVLLVGMGNRAEAEAEFRQAVELDPQLAAAHNNVGSTLAARGDATGAEAAVRRALAIDRENVDARNNLGNLYLERGEAASAEKEFRRALGVDPRNGRVHYNLAKALVDLGRFDEAQASARLALSLFPPGKSGHDDANLRVRYCEEMLRLERRLSTVLRGDARPADLAEHLALAETAARKGRYAVAARLYDQFVGDRGVAGATRYNAACAAALAGCGKGTDDPDATERARWRNRALEWLRADLQVQTPLLAAGAPKFGGQARENLLHWKADPDLAGVRDPVPLAALPPDERRAWKEFWAEIETALRAGGK